MNSLKRPLDQSSGHGPLFPYIGSYLSLLEQRGYQRSTTYPDSLLLFDLDHWLERQGFGVRDLSEPVLTRFMRSHMRTRRTRRMPKWTALRRLLSMLREAGKVPARVLPRQTASERLLVHFGRYLETERGFVETTVAGYIRAARLLLNECGNCEPVEVKRINAPMLINLAQRYARKHVPISSQAMFVGLRSFLRYLWLRKKLKIDLSLSVPKIAKWSLAGLPKHLPVGAVEKVIVASRTAGGRDHAIILVLARLGLRSCEVAELALDDLDWEHGVVRVHSRKGKRWTTLPMPVDVGRAIAAYLAGSRPPCNSRHVFIRKLAPFEQMTRMGIAQVARAAMVRANIAGTRLGPHTFRHTLATELLHRGATLHEIGEVLRHRDVSTTAVYAKVDLPTLQLLAVAWPGSAS